MINLKSEFIAWFFNEFKFDPLFVVMDGMAEDSPWHRESSIGIHTNMVVGEYLSRTPASWTPLHLLGAFAATFHDVGKPFSCEFKWKESRGDYKSFNGHELHSARLWEDWAVRNWIELTTTFQITALDMYYVSWMIEHHKPWGLKNETKLNNLAKTAIFGPTVDVYTSLMYSDTWGRLSDDTANNRENATAWIKQFQYRARYSKVAAIKEHQTIENQPTVVLTIGASGSGKSTLYQTEYPDYVFHSWDIIRTREYGDDYDLAVQRSMNDKQFVSKAHAEYSRLIKTGNNIFVDNTNTSAKRRRFFVDQARRNGYRVIAALLPSTLETVLDRQSTRAGKTVPVTVVQRQYFNTQMPQYGEFDDIAVFDNNLPQE
jgi:predicted kinase